MLKSGQKSLKKRIGMVFLGRIGMRCSDGFEECEIRVGFEFTVLNTVLFLGILRVIWREMEREGEGLFLVR